MFSHGQVRLLVNEVTSRTRESLSDHQRSTKGGDLVP